MEKLDSKSLMIGDWVTFRDAPNIPIKICGINEDGTAFVFIDKGKALDEITIDEEIVGIPLTPEILEKNGFGWTGSGDRTMMCGTPYGIEGIRYNIYVGLGKKYIEVHAAMPELKTERWRKTNKVYLEVCGCYVHELQHALKLCKIDKEIKL